MSERDEARSKLRQGLQEVGVRASTEAEALVLKHLDLVLEWNKRVNLTAITELPAMVVKHAIDSATILRQAAIVPGTRVLDVGSGAGFPGVTLKCLVTQANMTLAESLGKRCRFLEAVGRELFHGFGQGGFEVVWGRAEELGHGASYRGGFDVVVARAVADLRVLAEYCLPFVRIGGVFVGMKGPSLSGELAQAERAISLLGGEVLEVDRFSLPFDGGERTLVRIGKVGKTPLGYPRKTGIPAKSPL